MVLDVIVYKNYFQVYNHIHFWPFCTLHHYYSLVNLVVEVGTRHCHQILLIWQRPLGKKLCASSGCCVNSSTIFHSSHVAMWQTGSVVVKFKILSFFTATPNDHQGASNYRSIKCLFNSLFRLTTKINHRSMLLSFMRGIHRWPVDHPCTKGQ